MLVAPHLEVSGWLDFLGAPSPSLGILWALLVSVSFEHEPSSTLGEGEEM